VSLSDIADLATWPPFVRRIQAAMVTAAKDVAAELEPENPTPRSTLRRALSVNVFANLDDYTRRFAIGVATNPAITHASSDNDIQFTVNSIWDAVAGAPPAGT
jgi:hypothetical protein